MSPMLLRVTANAVGKGLTAGLALVLTPAYVRLLGVEAYGLLGFLTSVQALLALLDVGLSTTVNREVSRLSARAESGDGQPTLVRTVEVVYWGVALLVLSGIWAAAPWIVQDWLAAADWPPGLLQQALLLMGLVVLFQLPFYLYQGVLLGLERQLQLNAILGTSAILRFVGAWAALRYVAPTVTVFLIWNVVTVAGQTLVAAAYTWRTLPRAAARPRFDAGVLRTLWRFGFGVSLITISGAALWQVDKLILSRYVTWAELGYYSLASFVASSLVVVAYTLFNAVFPRFSYLVAAGQTATLGQVYHEATQGLALLVVPLGTTFSVLAYELSWAWTGHADVAEHMGPYVALLTAAMMLSNLYCAPLALQFACGWTRVSGTGLVAGVAVLPPVMAALAPHYGAVGVAGTLLAFFAIYVPVCAWLVHRRLLPQVWLSWFQLAFGLPLLLGFSLAGASALLRPASLGRVGLGLWVSGTWLTTSVVLALVLPTPRRWLQRSGRRLGRAWPLLAGLRSRPILPRWLA